MSKYKEERIHDIIEVTYKQLKNLRNNSQLIPGKEYRITNFGYYDSTDFTFYQTSSSTTIYGNSDVEFDIIVKAIDCNELSEEARVEKKQTSTSSINYSAWKIWYCLDSDEYRFDWASISPAGVIYRMIDEYGNDLPFDFRNIAFTYDDDVALVFYYTDSVNWYPTIYNNVVKPTYSTITNDDSKTVLQQRLCQFRFANKNSYDNFIDSGCCRITISGYGNKIGKYCGGINITGYSNVLGDNCGVMSNETMTISGSYNTLGIYCYRNTITGNSNVFVSRCYQIGVSGSYNILDNYCMNDIITGNSNYLYTGSIANTIYGDYNILKNYSSTNTIGTSSSKNNGNILNIICSNNAIYGDENILGSNCSGNYISSSYNKIGNCGVSNNITDNYNVLNNNCSSNIISGKSNYLYNSSSANTIYGDYNILKNYSSANTIGTSSSKNNYNILNTGCGLNKIYGNGNIFGSLCNNNLINSSYNKFGNGCCYNYINKNSTYNKFGNDCYYNYIGGTYSCYNTFGNGSYCNRIGTKCYNNTFGNGCSNCCLGYVTSTSSSGSVNPNVVGYSSGVSVTTFSNMSNVCFEDGVSYVGLYFPATHTGNIVVHRGIHGGTLTYNSTDGKPKYTINGDYLIINIPDPNYYEQQFYKEFDPNELKIISMYYENEDIAYMKTTTTTI
jgi:hypothetical protein